ncbi:MAG: hypothetical protein M0Z61_01260 [Nitrospiraceae bacterium]|nr:hypothetical protein [Nitrospiraceae bacterium]
MSSHSDKISEFEKQLFEKTAKPLTISSNYTIFSGNIAALKSPGSLPLLLSLDKEILSNREIEVLKILDGRMDQAESDEKYIDFKWKLLAFFTIQDVFEAPFLKGDYQDSIFRQWYFYYESKYILTEAILCGLNGFRSSIGPLLRLFLEFNLIQNYYYRNINDTRSYRVLENYLLKAIAPNWNTVINKCLATDDFSKPIKRRLQLHLKGLSESSNHPYHPLHSPKLSGSSTPGPTIERIFFFYLMIAMILEPVLWLYYVNFPMLFHPVDIEAKFGFDSPVGLFIDEQGGQIIKKSLPEEDYNHFLEYSRNQEIVKGLLEFYNGRDTLSEGEIFDTWDKDEKGILKNINEGHAKQMSLMRALRESMSFEGKGSLPSDAAVEQFGDLLGYDKWKSAYKKIK